MDSINLKKENIHFTVLDNKYGKEENYIQIITNKNFFNSIIFSLLMFKNSRPELENQITSREKEVLFQMASGKDNGQIAHDMNISTHTAKAHIKNIFQKLKVNDRTNAVVNAIKYNLINIYN